MPLVKYNTPEEKALAVKQNSKRAYEKKKELNKEKNRERYRMAHPDIKTRYPFKPKNSPEVNEANAINT